RVRAIATLMLTILSDAVRRRFPVRIAPLRPLRASASRHRRTSPAFMACIGPTSAFARFERPRRRGSRQARLLTVVPYRPQALRLVVHLAMGRAVAAWDD